MFSIIRLMYSSLNLPWVLLTGLASVFLYIVVLSVEKYRASKRAPYPPGPKGYPIINNLFDIPKVDAWKTYAEMSKQYGDMVFLRVFSQPILILSSSKRITDLLDKRSSTYSGRPQGVMASELLDFRTSFAVMNYSAKWRKHRKMFHQHYNMSVIPQYHPVVKRHVRKFLNRMLDNPKDFSTHTELLFGGALMHIGYGLEPQTRDDPYLTEIRMVLDAFKVSGIPGSFLVDIIPPLKYLPAWFPGAAFQRWATHNRAMNNSSKDKPYEYVVEAMKRNEAEPCVMTELISKMPSPDSPLHAEEESDVKNVVALSYIAGTDTVNSVTLTFILLMAKYPEYQRKAQEELDRVVGPNVLPGFEHRDDLVYLKAIQTELIRWFNVFPLALPHMTAEDDHYDGYFIPKGTVVLGNAWAVLHDPEIFEDPMEFKPERYLKDGKFNDDLLNPNSHTFGAGRRVCPGRYLAMDLFYLMAVSTLSMFDILPPKDKSGAPIELEASYDDGVFLNMGPFECIIQPRSTTTEGIIRGLLD